MRIALRATFAAAAAIALAACAASCSGAKAKSEPPSRVVIITASELYSPGEFRGAERLVQAYAAKGQKIAASHAVIPDESLPPGTMAAGAVSKGAKKLSAGASAAAIAAFVAQAADDPLVKAVFVDPAFPGTAEGIRKAKQAKPGLVGFVGGSSEDGLEVEASADLVIDLDRVYRAYLIPWASKKMGAKALVAVYSTGEGGDPVALRERAIMSAASADLGLRYAAVVFPADSDAAAYVRAMTGSWLHDYGPDASLYCSSATLTAPLIAGAIAGGGIVVDAAGQATNSAYASALGIDLSSAKGEPRAERKLVERVLESLHELKRFGAWDSDYAEASVEGVGEFALRVAAGSARKDDLKDLLAALDARSSGAAWLAAYDADPDTGVRSANRVLLRQDVYVLGSGYLQSALQAVPEKYLSLAAQPK